MAVAVAAAGAEVILTGRDEAALAITLRAIADGGGRAAGYSLDVTDHDAQEAFVREVWEHSPVDAVIANAGISVMQPSLEATTADFTRILETNVLGTFATLRAFGGRMIERGSGKLITVSSDIGLRGSAGWAAYGASKAAVINLTKTLAWEWAPTVTVNSIAPGAFATDINSHLLSVPEIAAGLAEATPLGRVGDASEIGPLAVFLCGRGSDFMTGQVLSIDGGIQRS
jgi:NAD(P)-dependent dehydrogenase (short-subunit alcohol dehydrogenase family)